MNGAAVVVAGFAAGEVVVVVGKVVGGLNRFGRFPKSVFVVGAVVVVFVTLVLD